MLQTQTVEPATLDLLKQIMKLPILEEYNLVGGTSLSLQLGHRISEDLDLFGKIKIDYFQLNEELSKLGELKIMSDTAPIYQAFLNGVKIDIVTYPYDNLEALLIEDGIRLVRPKDIAAMKITAIGTRGVKKDFFDLYFLLEQYSLLEIINFCESKFPNKDFLHYIKALTYFDDADKDTTKIVLLDRKPSWSDVKKRITQEVKGLKIL
jgi:hypothetical protein